jgi:hypothetical protein
MQHNLPADPPGWDTAHTGLFRGKEMGPDDRTGKAGRDTERVPPLGYTNVKPEPSLEGGGGGADLDLALGSGTEARPVCSRPLAMYLRAKRAEKES